MPQVILIDTETTGLPQHGPAGLLVQPRIVSITWMVGPADDPGHLIRTYVVCPDGFTIPDAVAAIHRITTERARAIGSPLAVVMQQLREDCMALRPQFVVAHNAAYDIPIVAAEFQRLGLPCPISPLQAICTMRTTTAFCRIPAARGNHFRWPKLQELHVRLFAQTYDGEHDSAADVQALARCFAALCRCGFYNAEFALPQTDLPPPFQPAVTRSVPPTLPQTTMTTEGQGFVFACNSDTVEECLQKQLFGAPTDWPLNVPRGSPCFLYNFSTHHITGVWRAVQAGMHIDRQAWGGAYPYQCRVEPMVARLSALPRADFPILAAGRIPNPLPAAHVAVMLHAFQTLQNE
jgi:DNA polymerase III epsilon subunit-like protein